MDLNDPILVALLSTPEMEQRLAPLIKEIVGLIRERVKTAAESFIVVHTVKKELESEHNMLLMPPINDREM